MGEEKMLDISECLGDSPIFRNQLANMEGMISDLESSIKTLNKMAKSGAEHAKAHHNKNSQFANELLEFAERERSATNDDIEIGLEKFGQALKELSDFQLKMITQMEGVFIHPIDDFVKKEIGKLTELRKKFQKNSDDYDSGLAKYLSKKPKDTNWHEASNDVADAKKSFHHSSLDYVMKMNEIQAKKKFEFMERLLALVFTQQSYFHHGYELLKDLKPFMQQLGAQLQQARSHYEIRLQKEESMKSDIIKRSAIFYNPMHFCATDETKSTTAITKEGYLFKRASQKMKQSWDRRYFVVQDDLLVYYTRGKDDSPIVATNLRLCSVKPYDNPERKHCFSVMSPIRSYILQAETEEDYHSWIVVLQNAIAAALNSDRSTDESFDLGLKKEKKEKYDRSGSFSSGDMRKKKTVEEEEQDFEYSVAIQEIKACPGNQECADCGTPDPEWASINHGILLCIECSGIHRSLGVHISKVRSLTLDKLEYELMQSMRSLGNDKANNILLGGLVRDRDLIGKFEVPGPKSERAIKEQWITAKYVERRFIVQPGVDKATLTERLYNSLGGSATVDSLFRLIVEGADVSAKHAEEENRTVLHKAVLQKSTFATDFILQWSQEVNPQDINGRTPLHYAAYLDHIRIVLLLLKRGANWKAQDKDGKTPVDLAIDEGNEDVIMIFRLVEANGGGRDALEKTSQLLQARNARASLRVIQHKIRKPLDMESLASPIAELPSPSD